MRSIKSYQKCMCTLSAALPHAYYPQRTTLTIISSSSVLLYTYTEYKYQVHACRVLKSSRQRNTAAHSMLPHIYRLQEEHGGVAFRSFKRLWTSGKMTSFAVSAHLHKASSSMHKQNSSALRTTRGAEAALAATVKRTLQCLRASSSSAMTYNALVI
eukprot:5435-Heterococcus_DN1.PRE.1